MIDAFICREPLVTECDWRFGGLIRVVPMFGCRAQHRAAVGHIRTAGEIVPTKKWAVFYYAAPSGSHFAISTRDLLEFVRLHHRPHTAGPARTPDRIRPGLRIVRLQTRRAAVLLA